MPKLIEKRERYYTRFLLDFLFEQDHKAWSHQVKEAEKIKGPRNLEEYATPSG